MLIGGFTVNLLIIFCAQLALFHHGMALFLRDRPHQALRRQDERTLNNTRPALCIQEGDERFTHSQFGNDILRLKVRVWAECLRRRAYCLLFGRRIGAQRMLNAVGKLRKDGIRNIARALRDEINADAFGANQFYDLLDLL